MVGCLVRDHLHLYHLFNEEAIGPGMMKTGTSGSQHGDWWNIHDEHEGFPPSQVCWPSKSTVSKEMDTKQISGKTQTWWCVHKFLWIPSRDNHPTWWISKQNMTFISTIQPLSALFFAAWISKLTTSCLIQDHPWLVFLSLFHLVVGVGHDQDQDWIAGNCRLEI